MPLKSTAIFRSSVATALLLLFSAPLPAENQLPGAFARSYGYGGGGAGQGALEGNYTVLSINRDQFNDGSAQAGYPGLSDSTLQLYGGGAMMQKGPTRWGVIGMSGALASSRGNQYSNWSLDFVALLAEQRYPGNGWEVTAGFLMGYGQFAVDYRGLDYSRFESRFYGSGGTAGLRWPTEARLSFFIRSGYLWLPANGTWHGALSGKMAKTYYDLSAPFGQAGMDLVF